MQSKNESSEEDLGAAPSGFMKKEVASAPPESSKNETNPNLQEPDANIDD